MNTVPINFSDADHSVWKILCKKRFNSLKDKASKLHQSGWDILGLTEDYIPNFIDVNTKLKSLTGWQVMKTNTQYAEDTVWLTSLANKMLQITEYIRDVKNLDYTPLPDIFHDAFGHIPFLAIPQYAQIVEKFGRAYNQAKTDADKLKIANLWWYSLEFGFIKENGQLKALGAGLISSESELNNALSENVQRLPWNEAVISMTERSAHTFHKTLFVLESLEQLEDTIERSLKNQ